MPGFLLHVGATVICSHAGQALPLVETHVPLPPLFAPPDQAEHLTQPPPRGAGQPGGVKNQQCPGAGQFRLL